MQARENCKGAHQFTRTPIAIAIEMRTDLLRCRLPSEFQEFGIPNTTSRAELRAAQWCAACHPAVDERVDRFAIDIAVHLKQADDTLAMTARGEPLIGEDSPEEDVQQTEEGDDATANPMGAHVQFHVRSFTRRRISACMELSAEAVAQTIAPATHLFVARTDDIGDGVIPITYVSTEDHSSE